ncbi:MAG: glycoside hydrolase family 15 protein, partial [Candidatus Binatia bacterium]
MAYQPIENYGLIGNMRTCALVGMNGSIDWFCFPHFDSPSVFASILDDQKGGRFIIAPKQGDVKHKQFYWPDTNVLVTRFLSSDGVGQVLDFMPVGLKEKEFGFQTLIRRVQCVRGTIAFRMECRPAFNYARDDHKTEVGQEGARFHGKELSIGLDTKIPVKVDGSGVVADFVLHEGQEADFGLGPLDPKMDRRGPLFHTEAGQQFTDTVEYWRRWLSKCTYTGRWREEVRRSALTLKLLTFEPTGAIVAAPTCSLPEGIGGERNWDYRFTWIRDAAFTLYGLLRIGFTDEAGAFMQWIEARCRELNPDGSLQVMYGIDGRHTLTEESLDHLDGYKGSRPVRVGNGAYNQLQLDIYGELMDSVYLFNKYGSPISYDLWIHLRQLINWVC